MAEFLFDTAFFIDLRRNRDSVASEFWKRIEASAISGAYSPITAYELWVGRHFTREEEVFYLAAFSLLEEAVVTSSAACAAAERLPATPERTEKLFREALIAASAGERGEVVVTGNVRDFESIGAPVHSY